MAQFTVELVKYDMDKTKKRKRKNFFVDSKTEEAIVQKLEKIHKGEKVQAIHEIIWAEEDPAENTENKAEIFTGKIKFYDDVKGFGFIEVDTDMDDLFFHASSLNGVEVTDLALVQFEVGTGPKGKIAVHVQLIE